MKNVCAAGETIAGYDVSHYQSNMSLHAQMKSRADKFCIIKADEGEHISDKLFHAHWNEAKAQGMIVGAYNFFHPSQNPIDQAKHFFSIVGKLGPGSFGPVIDWETTDGQPAVKDREAGLAYLEEVASLTGRDPIIYGGPYFLQDLKLDSRFLKYALWTAHYTAKCPLVPAPWTHWTFWQFTETGGLDLNVFNGGMPQLIKMAGM